MMIATPNQCLSDQELHDFAAGRLSNELFQSLLAHLDQCDRCQQRADQTTDFDDSFAAALSFKVTDDSDECEIIAEADCQAALFHASRSPAGRLDSMVPPIETLGPYRLLRPLGRGGMGAVYLAEHVRLRKKCAVKLLPRERGFDADWLQRFDREMQAIASLEHPNIVTATDAGDAEGWHYLVMEYLDGLDLATVVRRLGPMPIDIATAIARDVCRALAVIHNADLVHRDIKPSNVMLTGDGTVKVLDLGLVLDDRQNDKDMRLTTVGHVIGTLAFAAPEQLSAGSTVDARADLYSVGAMLFQLISGTPAHQADRGIAPLVIEKTSKPARNLGSVHPDVPEALDDFVSKLLDRDVAKRPAKATEVADELGKYATSKSLKPYASKAMRAHDGSESDALGFAWTSPSYLQPREGSSSWGSLLVMFGLPLTMAMLVAGFLFYVQTDRGVLVIESELDGLAVNIGHEDQSLDTLQVSAGKNETVLRSGRYSIQVAAQSDNVVVSDSAVTIRRGTKAIVKIRRKDGDRSLIAANDSGDGGDKKLYKGQSLDHWTRLMEVEHDVSTLTDAMKAVVSLAGTDDVDAAHSILLPARRLGGWTSSKSDTDPSQPFMASLNTAYARLMPQPGIEAIVRELKVGNERSRAACLWSLLNFDSQSWIYGMQAGRINLVHWAKDPKHREAAIALSDALRGLLRRPEVIQHGLSSKTARDLSMKIALATDRSLADEPGLEEELRRRIAEMPKAKSFDERVQAYRVGQTGYPQVYPHVLSPAQAIAAIRLGIELPPDLIVRSLLSMQNEFIDERNQLTIQRFKRQPQVYADEALLCLGTTQLSGMMGGGGGGFGSAGFGASPKQVVQANEEFWKRCFPKSSGTRRFPISRSVC